MSPFAVLASEAVRDAIRRRIVAAIAVLSLLRRFGAIGGEDEAALAGHLEPPVLNILGHPVGEIRAAF